MLGAGFLHMLVDATDDLSTLRVFNSTTFLPHLLSVVGILIPFALEKSGELRACAVASRRASRVTMAGTIRTQACCAAKAATMGRIRTNQCVGLCLWCLPVQIHADYTGVHRAGPGARRRAATVTALPLARQLCKRD